jgi:hypothetical protein
MTLPRLMACALRYRTQNDRSRYVFPIDEWALETAEHDGQLILTMRTPDGFEVSLGVSFGVCRPLATALLRAVETQT